MYLFCNYRKKADAAIVDCIIDDKRFNSIQLDVAAADDLYEKGRESSTCTSLLENFQLYQAEELDWKIGPDNRPIILRRLIIFEDKRVTLNVKQGKISVVEYRKSKDGKPFHSYGADQNGITCALDLPSQSPTKPEGTETDIINIDIDNGSSPQVQEQGHTKSKAAFNVLPVTTQLVRTQQGRYFVVTPNQTATARPAAPFKPVFPTRKQSVTATARPIASTLSATCAATLNSSTSHSVAGL